ncbi:MAG: DUF6443 domain-containing protein [Bacteroidota bacterium]|nr:DUF6443 domain-containing protein [Bacteroidota bacterium]
MKDLVADPVYDEYGKQTTVYLPYTEHTEGSFINQSQSINTNIPDFYSETPKISHTLFLTKKPNTEKSPYNRLLSSGAPGYSHQPEQGHTIDNTYTMNGSYASDKIFL